MKQQLLRDLRGTFDGEAWHGTPMRRMLEGVDEERASAHPIAGARSIAELTAHARAWMENCDRRLRGEQFEITPDIDFPSVEGVAWSEVIAQLERAHAALLATVEAMDDGKLEANVVGKPYTSEFMLRGLIHHTTYHAAQIAMLKKF